MHIDPYDDTNQGMFIPTFDTDMSSVYLTRLV